MTSGNENLSVRKPLGILVVVKASLAAAEGRNTFDTPAFGQHETRPGAGSLPGSDKWHLARDDRISTDRICARARRRWPPLEMVRVRCWPSRQGPSAHQSSRRSRSRKGHRPRSCREKGAASAASAVRLNRAKGKLLLRRLQLALQPTNLLRLHRIIRDDRFSLIALRAFEAAEIPALRTKTDAG
jgi:hypothetical protein